jgi:hypothetical protein
MNYKILTEVAGLVESYPRLAVDIAEGLDFNQYETIRMVDFYSASRYMKGKKDKLGREKPFFNIGNYRVTIATVATDFDVKDIQIEADNPEQWAHSMLLSHEVYEWMKQANFAKTLNDIGSTRARYGGVLVKKVMKGDKLTIEVGKWNSTICDPVDIMGGTIIETHYMSPVDLAQKRGVWENVDEAIELIKKTSNQGYKNKKEANVGRIPVYEVHGQFPKSYLLQCNGEEYDEDDEKEYTNQVYFIAGDDTEQVILFKDEEKEKPYMYLPWETVPGRGLGRGVWEDAEEAQVWTNDAVLKRRDIMDLAGKVLLKSNATDLEDNVLTQVDNGKIFKLKAGEDLNSLQITPNSLPVYETLIQSWKEQADRATSTFEANTGEQVPSGTPFSQTALLNQVASKPFDYRREEMGIWLQEMFNKWIIPHLIKKINQKHILASDYSQEELAKIDEAFTNFEGKKWVWNKVVNQRKIVTPEEYETAQKAFKEILGKDNRRFVEVPKDFFKDFEYKITVITTNETRNKGAVLQSLFTILQLVSSDPSMMQDPNISKLVGRMIEMSGTGISPISLGFGGGDASASIPMQGGQMPEMPQAMTAEPQA